ncbi:MAG: pentapeptide repeat-containing protein [Hyphomicrobiaceae bacterium]
MADQARGVVDTDTPVNPYSLLEAVNSSSETAHRAWIIFLIVMIYLMVAVAGVTHRDLLLDTPVKLPMMDVPIQLTQFFQFAPIVLVLLHLGVISQLVLLARKTLEFDHAVRMLETSNRRCHPLRLELHNFFFCQGLSGPDRSTVMSGFLHMMSWLTLAVLPIVLILYIQAVFLPYHDLAITWSHRIVLLVDMTVLVLIGIFLLRADTSFWQAFVRTTAMYPISFGLTAAVMAIVAGLSFFAATIPGETLDKVRRAYLIMGSQGDQKLAGSISLPFIGASTANGPIRLFTNHLIVTDVDLVPDKDVSPGEPTISLRGRDLSYAKFDRSDLQQADLTNANLSSASLIGTNLTGARMNCANPDEFKRTSNRKTAKCTIARNADFTKALLSGADLTGIDLTDSDLGLAKLDNANLDQAALYGANFSQANLRKAYFYGVRAQGASFGLAEMQGADLSFAHLEATDLLQASLQGAKLYMTNLHAADLRQSVLDGADMELAKLFGADMTSAKLEAADLRYAEIWATSPPDVAATTLADFGDLQIKPLSAEERKTLQQMIGELPRHSKQTKPVIETLAPLLDEQVGERWNGSDALATWHRLAMPMPDGAVDTSFPAQLTSYLVSMMCRQSWADGAVATGIVRRAKSEFFRGDMRTIYLQLVGGACPAGKTVDQSAVQELSAAIDQAADTGTALPRSVGTLGSGN